LSLALAPFTLLLWSLSDADTRPAATVLGGLMAAALAGLSAISEERQLGTWLADAAAVPLALGWRVKTGTAFAVAALGGILLPCSLLAVSPGFGPGLAGFTPGPRLVTEVLGLAMVVLVATALGLLCAALTGDLMHAFVGLLGAGAAALVVFLAGVLLGHGAVGALEELLPWPRSVGESLLGRALDQAIGLSAPLLMVAVALTVARRAWPIGAVSKGLLARAVGLVALGCFASGALRELLWSLTSRP
jgi:hypothetical protein